MSVSSPRSCDETSVLRKHRRRGTCSSESSERKEGERCVGEVSAVVGSDAKWARSKRQGRADMAAAFSARVRVLSRVTLLSADERRVRLKLNATLSSADYHFYLPSPVLQHHTQLSLRGRHMFLGRLEMSSN